jgi:hypothetical protein
VLRSFFHVHSAIDPMASKEQGVPVRSTPSRLYDRYYQALINKLAKTIFDKYEQKMIRSDEEPRPTPLQVLLSKPGQTLSRPRQNLPIPQRPLPREGVSDQPMQPVAAAAAAMPAPQNLQKILGQIVEEDRALQDELRNAEAEVKAPAAAAAAEAPAPPSMYERLKQAAIRAAEKMIWNNWRTSRSAAPAGIPMKTLTPKRGGRRHRTIRGGRRHRRRNNKSCRRRR